MPTERPKPDQPLIVPKGELAKRFTPLTPAELDRLSPSKPFKPETSPRPAEDLESLGQTFEPFLKDVFKMWGLNNAGINKFTNTPELQEPSAVDYKSKKDDTDAAKFGEYTLNPDTQAIDWETIPPEKIHVEAMSDMVGKKRWEVAQEIIKRYGDKYYLPGLEYYKFILENPAQAPDSLKDSNYHYFYGSLLRRSSGDWLVPCVHWFESASVFDRSALWLVLAWNADDRVVLLEK